MGSTSFSRERIISHGAFASALRDCIRVCMREASLAAPVARTSEPLAWSVMWKPGLTRRTDTDVGVMLKASTCGHVLTTSRTAAMRESGTGDLNLSRNSVVGPATMFTKKASSRGSLMIGVAVRSRILEPLACDIMSYSFLDTPCSAALVPASEPFSLLARVLLRL